MAQMTKTALTLITNPALWISGLMNIYLYWLQVGVIYE
jgi:hypothetical protein